MWQERSSSGWEAGAPGQADLVDRKPSEKCGEVEPDEIEPDEQVEALPDWDPLWDVFEPYDLHQEPWPEEGDFWGRPDEADSE